MSVPCVSAPPQVAEISPGGEVTVRGAGGALKVGDTIESWTLMGVIPAHGGALAAVFEDFTELAGHIVINNADGVIADLPKSIAPSSASVDHLYRGHTLEEVMNCDDDLLGREILAEPGDPTYAGVAACFPPIAHMFTYSFVGTRDSFDKVAFAYGGRSATFDPAVFVPRIRAVRERRDVADGLVGGWLPVVRFVYPEATGTWTELLAYAPLRMVNGNRHAQPVWYRVVRVEDHRLRWANYFDSYMPYPPRVSQPAGPFYTDLLATKAEWESAFAGGMTIAVPDPRIRDMAKHSLVRAMITRMGVEPKYGVVDRNYGGSEHDGFPDTFNTDTGTLCDWGLLGLAGAYLDNYFGKFIRDDGSLLYRGPETGQFGRMLTVVAQFVNAGGDASIVLKHRDRIDAVAKLLLALRREAQTLPPTDPAFGMIAGWSEADSAIDPDPARYVRPYFGNSAEAARGFHDLGKVWERLGGERNETTLADWGRTLVQEAAMLERDLQTAMSRSLITSTSPICLPSIAGVKEPFHLAVRRDALDPLFRGYRSYMEMLFSGELNRDQVEMIIRYRAAHRDIILGVPTAYGYNTNEPAGFLAYGHAYGLLQHDRVREFLLTLYSLMAHHYTRGTWTAPETRSINPATDAAPYCVPAQLVVPMLTRWMLAFEDPHSEILWLTKATPREWLADGQVISADNVPTRWGRINFAITSHVAAKRIEAVISLPTTPFVAAVTLRLRVPSGHRLTGVVLNGEVWKNFDPELETVNLPPRLSGRVTVVASYSAE